MVKYTPPIDGDEMVLVTLDMTWCRRARFPRSMFRLTKSAWELVDKLLVQSEQLHERSWCSVRPTRERVHSSDELVGGDEEPVPEGSYLIRGRVEAIWEDPVALTWAAEDLDLGCRLSVSRWLDDEKLGLLNASPEAYRGTTVRPNIAPSSWLWLVPLRNLDTLVSEPSGFESANLRGYFNTSSRTDNWFTDRVKVLAVDPAISSFNAVDNRFMDDTPAEDWMHFDCEVGDLVKAIR